MTVVDRPIAEQTQGLQLFLDLERAGAITNTSLTLTDPTMPFDTAEALGAFLGAVKRRTSWYIGDWLNFCESVYGEEFAQAAEATGLSEQTLLNYKFVCAQVAPDRRQPGVSFGCHALVARLDPREQNAWLKQAAKKGWGEKELRAAMAAKRAEMRPPLPGTEKGDADPKLIHEVAEAILRDAKDAGDGQHVLVPVEDITRLRAALGQED